MWYMNLQKFCEEKFEEVLKYDPDNFIAKIKIEEI